MRDYFTLCICISPKSIRVNIILILSILLLNLLISSDSLSNSTSEWDTSHYGSVIKFEGDIENKTLTFLSEGKDSSLVVSLPEHSKIESATVDIEGRLIVGGDKVIINYTDTVNNKAWSDDKNMEFPVKSPPSKFKKNSFNTNDYDDVNALDKRTKSTLSGVNSMGYPIHLYEFDLSNYAVFGFEVFWVGSYMHMNGANVDGMNVSIWNAKNNTWEIIGGYYSGFGEQPKDNYISKSYINPSGYINSSSKLLYVIVYAPLGAGWSTCELYTNYISINITQGSSYPLNPYLNIGGDDDKDWTFEGELSTKVSYYGNNFVNELQEHVDTRTPVGNKIDIPFIFSVERGGELYISDLTIIFVTNKEPTTAMDIPIIFFYEDSGWYDSGIDVTKYFQDVDDSISNLTFELHGHTLNIWGAITSEYILNFTSSANYFGMAEFNVSCRDMGFDGITNSDDSIVYSNNFTVTVLPSDDPPVIRYIDDKPVMDNSFLLSAKENVYLNFTVRAEDIDGDEILYSINGTEETLSLDGNNVSFLPKQKHVGLVYFTITATETNISKLYDFVDITIEVENTNDAPIIEDIGYTMVDEDVWVNFTVRADDVDLLYNNKEKLTYNTNFSDTGIDAKVWDFDEDTGEFSFLPDNSLVGRYHINFSVEDNYEEKDWCHTIIDVKNVNDPPIAKQISFTIVDADETTPELENLTVNFTTEPAIDSDLIHGDMLIYSWDFDASDGISADATGLNVIWTYPAPGNYTVTLTVSDSGLPKLTNSTSIIIQVLTPKEDKSEEDDDYVVDDIDIKEGKSIWLWITLGIISLVIIIFIIFGFVIMKMRQNISNDKSEEAKVKGNVQHPVYPSVPASASIVAPVDQSYLSQGVKAPGEQPQHYYPLPEVKTGIAEPPIAQKVEVKKVEEHYKTTTQPSNETLCDEESNQNEPV